MAEKIFIGNSYQKDLFLTTTDEYGNDEPLDLSMYDDCYFAIKKNRATPDEESYILKKFEPLKDQEGTIILYLSPEETKHLPETTMDGINNLWMFVQIGSTATGVTKEIGSYKVKTILAGIKYYTQQDTNLSDLGPLSGYVGFIFDCGELCYSTIVSIDLSGGEPYISDCGYLVTNGMYEIINLGALTESASKVYDLEYIEKDCS